MIISIGSDMVDSRRIEGIISRHGQKFIDRIFTPKEQEYCQSKSPPHLSFSRTFAAKEALIKALKGAHSLKWHDIEIIRLPGGAPTVKLSGSAHNVALDLSEGALYFIHLSISDEPPYAIAHVIFEKRGK